MKNLMMINGVKAFIDYDPDAETFRGEFVGLNGGADFYGESVAQLEAEGAKSLSVFLEMCQERGIEPYKNFLANSTFGSRQRFTLDLMKLRYRKALV